jgi:hypothetical protein
MYLQDCLVGCACSHAHCSPGKCDHVNLFDSVHENPVDIYGIPMRGRFAYDENSKIILQVIIVGIYTFSFLMLLTSLPALVEFGTMKDMKNIVD